MIRGYTNTDLVCTARVWLRSGQAEYHYLKAFQELNEKKAIDVFRCCIQDKCEIWVYETKEGIIGFMAMNASLVDRLYVDPKNQGMGVGSKLINYAKTQHPTGLSLRTHQQNKRARAFYEGRGFVAVSYGLSPPPESMPDMEYYWSSDECT